MTITKTKELDEKHIEAELPAAKKPEGEYAQSLFFPLFEAIDAMAIL